MTDSEIEIEKTVALLRAAPIERFVKAVAELDLKGDLAEVLEIKHRIRDRLAEIRPHRILNIARVFCDPFEEMLRDEVEPKSTWIPRGAVAPCWRIVEGMLPSRALLEIRAKIDNVGPADRDYMPKLGAPLWEAAGAALSKVAGAARGGDAGSRELFGNDNRTIGHAEIIAAACQVAQAIEELKSIFPERPFKSLQLADRELLRTELQRISADQKHDLRCVIHVVAHWTQNPAEIFDLCADLDLGKATPLGKLLLAQREKVVVGLVGEQLKKLQSDLDAGKMDLADCAEMARVAADSIDSALELIADRKASPTDNGIGQLREELGSMVKERVLNAATQALSSVWGGGKAAGEAPGRDSIVAAEAAARAMRKCGQVAAKLGIETAISPKITASLDTVRGEVNGLIDGLEKGAKDVRPGAAHSTLANATRILEILEGPERAFAFFREKRDAIRAHT